MQHFTDNLSSLFQKATSYAGVGSRDTPEEVGLIMCAFALAMDRQGATLRSGGASGADSAFESGALLHKEIYLPYPYFNKNRSLLIGPSAAAFEIAKSVHPAWNRCTEFAQKAHARNAHQVLGALLDTPVSFVACWTKDGATTEQEAVNAGGTRTAIVIAERHGIPVLNFRRTEHLQLAGSYFSDKDLEQAHRFLHMGTVRPPAARSAGSSFRPRG